MKIGIIGAGQIGMAIADKLYQVGQPFIMSSRGEVERLKEKLHPFGELANAANISEVAEADIIFLAVRWSQLEEAVSSISNWKDKIVVDTTNPIWDNFTFADLGEYTSSEVVASRLPGAKVIKAFNTLLVEWILENPIQPNGKRVLFISGDDLAAKNAVIQLVESFGFASVDLGGLRSGGLLQQAGKPLALLNLLRTNTSSN